MMIKQHLPWLKKRQLILAAALINFTSQSSATSALHVFEPNQLPMHLESSGVTSKAGYTQVTQGSGIVLWGPYVNLPEGQYTAFFTVRSPEDSQRVTTEVVHSSSKGDDLFATTSLTLPSEDWTVVSLDFTLTADDKDKRLEFRLWKNQATMLHIGSIFVAPRHLQQVISEKPSHEASAQSIAAWVEMQAEHLSDEDSSRVLAAFRLLTAISKFNSEASLYEYFHPLKIIGRLRETAEGLLQDKKLQFPKEVREELLQHWVSLRVQMMAGQDLA